MNMDSKISNVLIKVNGEDKLIPQNTTILKLLELFKLNQGRVVMELNNQVLRKEFCNSTLLKQNDKLEIVTFVGGG